jgi:cytochrome c-type biogenesis protein CcmH
VLLRPPIRADTYLLWFGPFALLLLGGGVAYVALRRRRPVPAVPLSAEEQARLDALMREEPK